MLLVEEEEIDAIFEVLSCVLIFQLNPDVNVFQRKFVNEVRRCEEMDRKLRMCILVLCDVSIMNHFCILETSVLNKARKYYRKKRKKICDHDIIICK
jgi:hypothetical protein